MMPFKPLDIAKFFADPTNQADRLRASLHTLPEIPQHVQDQIAQAEQAREALEAIKLRTLPTRA
ncbi:hypothetical protein [Pararhodobacter aggregans]